MYLYFLCVCMHGCVYIMYQINANNLFTIIKLVFFYSQFLFVNRNIGRWSKLVYLLA